MKNKIIFWMDAFLLHYCLAFYMQKKYDAEYYGIVDISNKPKSFFQTQELLKLKKFWFYHDQIHSDEKPDLDYLSKFEKKYEINLWQLAINERIFYRFNDFYKFSDNQILSILEQECKFYESILDEIKPNLIIAEKPVFHHSHIFSEICKAKKIKTLFISQSRLAYKSILSSDPFKLDSLKDFENIDSKNRSFEELLDFLKSSNVSKQLKTFKDTFTTSKIKKAKAAKEFLLFSENTNLKSHYTYFGRTKSKVILHELLSSMKKKYRSNFIDKNLSMKIPENEKFVYFPLGMDEERNLLIGAPFFTNQVETVRHIAKSLPINYKLYVKEHYTVSIRDWRKTSDYDEIMAIPNVKLFHPSVSNDKLIKNCSLVISAGGTSSFEAVFYQKPSIIFTDTNYSILPSVFKVNSIQELPSVIRQSLLTQVESASLDKFLQILEKDSIDFDIYGYMSKMHEHFYFGGNLADVEISTPTMKSFLEKNKTEFESLADAHIRKINDYDQSI